MRRFIVIPQLAQPLQAIPAPTLSASPVSSTQIVLTATYSGPPTFATYSYYVLTGGTFTLITTTTNNIWGVTGLSPSTTYTFRVNVQTSDGRNSMYSAVQSATTQIASALQITTSSPLPAGTVGIPYSQTMTAINGTPPYTWSITAGTLPTGLSFSTGGVFSGTPTVASSPTLTIKVTDSASGTASAPFNLTISAAGGVLTLVTTLPNATQYASYSGSWAATGGTPPYTFAATAATTYNQWTTSNTKVTGTPNLPMPAETWSVTVTDSATPTPNQASGTVTLNTNYVIPAGAQALGYTHPVWLVFQPTLSNVTPGPYGNTATNDLYLGYWGYSGTSFTNSACLTMVNGVLNLAYNTTGTGGESWVTTQNTNGSGPPSANPGLLPFLPNGNGWYVDFGMDYTNWSTDNFGAVWLQSTEYNNAGTSGVINPAQTSYLKQWLEIDVWEGGGAGHCGNIDYHNGVSGTQASANYQNATVSGLTQTIPHVYGASWNPNGVCTWYIDNVTTGNENITGTSTESGVTCNSTSLAWLNTQNMYALWDCGSHGASTPYTMNIYHVMAWIPPNVSSYTWKTLPVGGGGWARGLIQHADGTLVARTDTAGAYLYNGTKWNQLINSSSMPSSYIAANPTCIGGGCYEIAIYAGNSQVMYMNFNNALWKSINQGSTWTQLTGWGTVSCNPNPGAFSPDQMGQKIAIDPQNSNIVYSSVDGGQIYVTTNGGTTWGLVSGLSNGTAAYTGILFSPTSSVVGGVTQVIYACRAGTGVYISSNGGSTWALTSGGPSTVQNAQFDSAGNYWAVGGGTAVWKYNGTWTSLVTGSSNGMQAVAVNPFNTSVVMGIDQAGEVYWSNNTGATWSTVNRSTSLVDSTIPWLPFANHATGQPNNIYLSCGNAVFSNQTNGLLYVSAGTGAWSMTVPATVTSSTALTYNGMSVGMENMVALEVIVPPGLGPCLANWDRAVFYNVTPGTYPSSYLPVMGTGIGAAGGVTRAWSIDYASSSPTFVCAAIDGGTAIGYTTDGTTWNSFATQPSGGASIGNNNIASSTPQNILFAASNGAAPSYTLNQGSTWTAITVPGVASWSGFINSGQAAGVIRRICADRVNATTFYLYFPGKGVYMSSNGGATWTQQGSTTTIDPNANNSYLNSRIEAVPTQAGHLFYSSGQINGNISSTNQLFYRSTNSGVTWTSVANVTCVSAFAFGAPNPSGGTYPSVWICGFVSGVLGMYRSDDNCVTWHLTGTYPTDSTGNGLFAVMCLAADMNNFGSCYAALGGYGLIGEGAGASYAYFGP